MMLVIASGQVRDGADPALALAENLAIAHVVGWVDNPTDEAATRQQFESFLGLLKLDEPLEEHFAILDSSSRRRRPSTPPSRTPMRT